MDQKRIVETTLRVRYAETDAMRVVYHASYLVWFEVGRGDFFRALDQDYGEWERQGYFLPVAEAHAHYHAPARYGDLVVVRTWAEHVRSRGLTLGHKVRHAANEAHLVTGWTEHICMDREGRARTLPGDMLHLLEEP